MNSAHELIRQQHREASKAAKKKKPVPKTKETNRA